MVQRLILVLGQFELNLSSPAMGEKTELQQVDRTQRRLNPLNPFTLNEVFFTPMAQLRLKPRGLSLRFQAGKVIIDLTPATADLCYARGSGAYVRTASELCQHPYVPHKQFRQLFGIALRPEAVEEE